MNCSLLLQFIVDKKSKCVCVGVCAVYTGITSTITIVLWLLLTSNTPAEHPRISKREREYIVNSLKGEVADAKPTVY